MSLSIRWNRWLRLFSWRGNAARRPHRRVAADDFADCGTAFGLDLSMSVQPATRAAADHHPEAAPRQPQR